MTAKVCSVEDCNGLAKARGYCDKHYRRVLHNDSLEVKIRKDIRYGCIVPYCDGYHKANGVCSYHYGVLQKLNTPFNARIVKYCGWHDCNEVHYAKGLCQGHYYQWLKVLNREGLDRRDIYQ